MAPNAITRTALRSSDANPNYADCSFKPNNAPTDATVASCTQPHQEATQPRQEATQPHQCHHQVEKLDGFSSAEYKRMRTSAAAPSDSYPSAENKTIQSDAAGAGAAGATAGAGAAATNATTSTPGTSSSQNKDPYAVKFVFKENKLEKVDGIYGDWIPDLPH
ncbi:unnamed protein product [Sphenostylis stenocarpa]|uniref:Uncharacterized protein n=1 Tax=Sphenostylis stenocarpa TaxID=92480 RepID=A0AA86VYN9_9FABA|nr:unnamed protein product [Sphenostylis stenocarpa]